MVVVVVAVVVVVVACPSDFVLSARWRLLQSRRMPPRPREVGATHALAATRMPRCVSFVLDRMIFAVA